MLPSGPCLNTTSVLRKTFLPFPGISPPPPTSTHSVAAAAMVSLVKVTPVSTRSLARSLTDRGRYLQLDDLMPDRATPPRRFQANFGLVQMRILRRKYHIMPKMSGETFQFHQGYLRSRVFTVNRLQAPMLLPASQVNGP